MRKNIIRFTMVMSTMLGMNSAFAGGYVGVGFNVPALAFFPYAGVDVYEGKSSTGSIEISYVNSNLDWLEDIFGVLPMKLTHEVKTIKLMYLHDKPITKNISLFIGGGISHTSGETIISVSDSADGLIGDTITPIVAGAMTGLAYEYYKPNLLAGIKAKLTDSIGLRFTLEASIGDDEERPQELVPTDKTISASIFYSF